MGPAATMAFVNLFRTRSSASRQGDYSDALETASLISALEADLRGADQLKALQGLRDMLREPNGEFSSLVRRNLRAERSFLGA